MKKSLPKKLSLVMLRKATMPLDKYLEYTHRQKNFWTASLYSRTGMRVLPVQINGVYATIKYLSGRTVAILPSNLIVLMEKWI